jgi:hypothetical protein
MSSTNSIDAETGAREYTAKRTMDVPPQVPPDEYSKPLALANRWVIAICTSQIILAIMMFAGPSLWSAGGSVLWIIFGLTSAFQVSALYYLSFVIRRTEREMLMYQLHLQTKLVWTKPGISYDFVYPIQRSVHPTSFYYKCIVPSAKSGDPSFNYPWTIVSKSKSADPTLNIKQGNVQTATTRPQSSKIKVVLTPQTKREWMALTKRITATKRATAWIRAKDIASAVEFASDSTILRAARLAGGSRGFFTSSQLAEVMPGRNAQEAISRLRETGKLQRLYIVRTPDNQILDEVFLTLDQIPATLHDERTQPFNSDDARVEPAYRLVR